MFYQSSSMLAKVTPCEFASGSGFEIAFELHRRFFLVELDDDEHAPWPKLLGVSGKAFVVVDQSCTGI